MPEPVANALAAAVAAATGRTVRRLGAVHGGDTAAAYRVELDDGDQLFAKTHGAPPPGFFTTEAAGLEWLRAAGAVRVPAVVAVSDGGGGAPAFLALEWIPEGRPRPDTEARFGTALAALHAVGAPAYGREDRRTTGSLALPNEPTATWSEFYRSCRLLPLARVAATRDTFPAATITALEQVADTLERFDDGRPPARLHGDLWAGNRLVDVHGESWLVDPAAHGGHPEFDLAMMQLFGGYGPAVLDSYRERNPLGAGWEARIELHQIAPLVVHAVKFGGGYVRAATAAILRYA